VLAEAEAGQLEEEEFELRAEVEGSQVRAQMGEVVLEAGGVAPLVEEIVVGALEGQG
jgi:hypothetical protein